MVLLPGFLEVLGLHLWVVGSQALWSIFLHHWVADRDIYVLIPCISWHAPLTCLNLLLTLLHVPRIPCPWDSPSILAQFFSWAPQRFSWHFEGWAGLLSSFCFMRPEACLFLDFGFLFITLNRFGASPPFSLFKAQIFYFPRSQSFVLFWALVKHCDFLDLNTSQ